MNASLRKPEIPGIFFLYLKGIIILTTIIRQIERHQGRKRWGEKETEKQKERERDKE